MDAPGWGKIPRTDSRAQGSPGPTRILPSNLKSAGVPVNPAGKTAIEVDETDPYEMYISDVGYGPLSTFMTETAWTKFRGWFERAVAAKPR